MNRNEKLAVREKLLGLRTSIAPSVPVQYVRGRLIAATAHQPARVRITLCDIVGKPEATWELPWDEEQDCPSWVEGIARYLLERDVVRIWIGDDMVCVPIPPAVSVP